MNIFNIFPSPVFIENCPLENEVKEIVNQQIKNNKLIKNENCPNLLHLDNQLKRSVLYKKEFNDFRNWSIKCANYYVNEVIGYDCEEGLIITDSWINVCNKNGYQVPHYHTNSYISGTYYVNIDIENGHSPLTFRHQDNSTHQYSQSISLGVTNKQPTLYNSDAVLCPQNGQLFLWQSHLTHGYINNDLDNRISISMNFMPIVMKNYRYAFKLSPHE